MRRTPGEGRAYIEAERLAEWSAVRPAFFFRKIYRQMIWQNPRLHRKRASRFPEVRPRYVPDAGIKCADGLQPSGLLGRAAKQLTSGGASAFRFRALQYAAKLGQNVSAGIEVDISDMLADSLNIFQLLELIQRLVFFHQSGGVEEGTG